MSNHDTYATGPRDLPFAALVAPVHPFAEAISDVIAGIPSAIRRTAEALAARRLERRTVRMLATLSDDTLRDIGIRRGEIAYVAQYMVRHPGSDYRQMSL